MPTYRYKRPKKNLNKFEKEFCEQYACNNFDSLSAYKVSHRNNIKARASILLQHTNIWLEIFEEIIKKDKMSRYEETLVDRFSMCIEKTGNDPFTLIDIYKDVMEESNDLFSEDHYDDLDPSVVFIKLSWAYHFFIFLNREYFISRTRKAMTREYNHLNELAKRHSHWRDIKSKTIENLLDRRIHIDNILIK